MSTWREFYDFELRRSQQFRRDWQNWGKTQKENLRSSNKALSGLGLVRGWQVQLNNRALKLPLPIEQTALYDNLEIRLGTVPKGYLKAL